ncbi:DUF1648 domain-containing protein [Leifsonia poae]|uniref:DUF1648 domain-containing protein n=1 Tax=Leifsonia poae TaxID=110933 RepID=UPI001CBB438A|nr:DUF1648 domain-containing protein [Leifsonia poae]
MNGRIATRVCQVIALFLALVPFGALVVAGIVVGPQLGPRMASHWSGGATPDGYSDTWSSFWIFVGIVIVITVAGIAAVVASVTSNRARLLAAFATGMAGLSSLAWFVPALATAAAPSPEQATLDARMLMLIPVVALGVAVFLILRPAAEPVLDEDADEAAPTVPPLRAGDRLVWTGTTGTAWFTTPGALLAAGGVACLVVAAVRGTPGLVGAAVALLLIGGVFLFFGRMRLRIDARGMRLSSALFRLPIIRVRLESVANVSAEVIDPLRWGGWGFRLSGRGLAYVLGKREGLVVERQRGLAIAVTIGQADRARDALELLVRQHRELDAERS